MSDRLHCPGCGIPTIEGGLDTTEEELYCNRCVEELERNMSTNKPAGGAQFTPGPWAVNKSDTCLIMVSKSMGMGAEKHIADVQYNEERYANAHLIAAAPAMYAAMGDLISLFDMRLPNGLALNQVLPKEVWERVSTVVSMAKQVKAQAEGRER